MSNDGDLFVMYTKILDRASGPSFRHDHFYSSTTELMSNCLSYENKGKDQSMFVFAIIGGNKLLAISYVTGSDKSTSPFATSFACRRSLSRSTLGCRVTKK